MGDGFHGYQHHKNLHHRFSIEKKKIVSPPNDDEVHDPYALSGGDKIKKRRSSKGKKERKSRPSKSPRPKDESKDDDSGKMNGKDIDDVEKKDDINDNIKKVIEE